MASRAPRGIDAAAAAIVHPERAEIDGSPVDAVPASSGPPDSVVEDGSAAGVVKKPAWKRPSNGAIEVGPVMGAESWPALSESATGKVSSKGLDGSVAAASPSPIIPTSSSSPKRNMNNLNPSLNPNYAAPVRQKSNKNMAPPAMLDKQATVEEGQSNRNINNWEHGNRSGGDHRRYGGNNRRSNNGGGGGGHHGGRHDQERGGFDGYNRNFVGRDVHLPQQQRGVRPPPFIRAPLPVIAPPPPFIGPPPQGRPFGSPMGFPEVTSPVYYVPPPPETLRGVPFVSHPVGPPPFIIPTIDPQRAFLLKQIDYYFSSENLCKDIFLRQNMDDQGWVPISLIAGFNRVKQLTNNLAFIMETVQLSTIVELQGDKIRKRNDWMSWVLPQPENFTVGGPLSPATPNIDTVTTRLRTVGLEGATNHFSMRRSASGEAVVLGRSASGQLNNQLQVVDDLHGDGISRANEHNDSDQSESVKSLPRSDSV